MTLNDFIIDNNCKTFNELKERLCNKYAALRVKMKGVDYSYLFSLNPKVDNCNTDRYLSDEWLKTINNVTACTFLHEINGMRIESIEPVTKDTLDDKEVALLFAHEANVFDDTFDFQVKYGLMTREEMFEKAPYFIEKDNLMMKIGHLKEELAEIEKAAENGDLAEFADGIIDLIYVAAGLGNLCRLPMKELWNDVQNSNMVGKERVTSLDNATKRGSTFDVRKTDKWVGPRGADIIKHFSIGK